MKLDKIIARIKLTSTELDSIVGNEDVDTYIRCKAGRTHFDLIDDYECCIQNGFSDRMLRDLMIEYEAALMDIYKQI